MPRKWLALRLSSIPLTNLNSIRAYRMKLEEWGIRKYRSGELRSRASPRLHRSQGQRESISHESSAASFPSVIEGEIVSR